MKGFVPLEFIGRRVGGRCFGEPNAPMQSAIELPLFAGGPLQDSLFRLPGYLDATTISLAIITKAGCACSGPGFCFWLRLWISGQNRLNPRHIDLGNGNFDAALIFLEDDAAVVFGRDFIDASCKRGDRANGS